MKIAMIDFGLDELTNLVFKKRLSLRRIKRKKIIVSE